MHTEACNAEARTLAQTQLGRLNFTLQPLPPSAAKRTLSPWPCGPRGLPEDTSCYLRSLALQVDQCFLDPPLLPPRHCASLEPRTLAEARQPESSRRRMGQLPRYERHRPLSACPR